MAYDPTEFIAPRDWAAKQALSKDDPGRLIEADEFIAIDDAHAAYAVEQAGLAHDAAVATAAADATAKANAAAAASVPLTQRGAANGVATLDSGGKVPEAQLPAIAITETFVVASQSAMLALTAQRGDVATRTDLGKTFILQAEPAATLGNWVELRTPTDAVQSVAGRTGAVTLAPADAGVVAGSTPGTFAAGDDARLSDQRTPVDGSVTAAKIADGAVTAAKVAADVATQAELDALSASVVTAAQLPVPRPSAVQAYSDIAVPAGAAIVALRFDDSDAAVRDTVLPLLVARGIPAGFAPSMGVLGTSTNLTNADLLSIQRQGHDVMVQWDEATLADDAAFRAHAMALADSLEAAQPGLRLDTFTESGVWDSTTKATYGGQSETFLESAVGREFRRRFVGSLGYAKDDIGTTFVRPIPAVRRYGANHVTLDGVSTLSGWQAPVLLAEAMQGAIEILCHPRNIGLGGQISLVNFTAWLDWLVTERDAGRIVLLTPTAALHATVGTRTNLLGPGSLDGWAASATNSPFTGTATASADGTGRGGTGKAAICTTSAQLSLSLMSAPSLRTIEVGGWAKAQTGSATARLLVRSYAGATLLHTANVTPAVTDAGWTNVRRVIGCDPTVTSVTVSWYAQTGTVLWDDIAIHKA